MGVVSDPLARGCCCSALANSFHDLAMIATLCDVEHGPFSCAEVRRMRMGVDKARNHGGTVEVHNLGRIAGKVTYLRSNSGNVSVVVDDRRRLMCRRATAEFDHRSLAVGSCALLEHVLCVPQASRIEVSTSIESPRSCASVAVSTCCRSGTQFGWPRTMRWSIS